MSALIYQSSGMALPDEMCEVTPVLWLYVSHVLFEAFPTDLNLPLQTGLVADSPRQGGSGLYVQTVSSCQREQHNQAFRNNMMHVVVCLSSDEKDDELTEL